MTAIKPGPRAGGTRPRPPRPVRDRTRRRSLQRWGVKHAAVIEELNAALSGALVAMTGVVESLEGQLPGGEDAAHRSIAATGAFLGAVAAAEALPPVPDATAGVSFTRTLSLWRTGAEVHLASLRPFDAERSVRAATILEHGAAEFSRFAESFVLGGL